MHIHAITCLNMLYRCYLDERCEWRPVTITRSPRVATCTSRASRVCNAGLATKGAPLGQGSAGEAKDSVAEAPGERSHWFMVR